jgi:hypothetical protein
MTANPLKVVGDTPRPGQRTAQEWVDRGNAILAGIIPSDSKKFAGQYMFRDDVHWFLENGQPKIGWRR